MPDARPVAVVIQSRLASTRLPAKALLPVGGMAALLLCARRCANTGLDVVVATSVEVSDHPIAELMAAAGVRCIRGPHVDVLGRFVLATDGLPQDGVVVRLTADNVLPDGQFVEALLREHSQGAVDYLGTRSPQDGLPYGMSAEVFTVRVLRHAHAQATAPWDREHVTPWIIRHGSSRRYRYAAPQPHWAHLRCTLDTLDDYQRLLQVFAGVADPVGVPWTTLVDRVADATPNGHKAGVPTVDRPDGTVCSALTLGTAQFGMSYGVANDTGVPLDAEISELLSHAADCGVLSLDTARAYGESEERIGRCLSSSGRERIRIVTKLDVLQDIPDNADPNWVRSAVDASVFRSCHALRVARLDTLLLHRWAHRHAWGGGVWVRLRELRRMGLVGVVGASVSAPEEAIAALQDPEVGHVQCPVNVLDWRWRHEDFLAAVKARPDVVVHARSVLLQGLLALPAGRWLPIPGVDAARLCHALDGLVVALGRLDRVDLCIAYVRALPWITSIVLGMDNRAQLQRNLALVGAAPLTAEEVRSVDSSLPRVPETLLNPALWRPAHG